MFNLIEVAEAHSLKEENGYMNEIMMEGRWNDGHHMGGFGFMCLIFWMLVFIGGYCLYKNRCKCAKEGTSEKTDKENKIKEDNR